MPIRLTPKKAFAMMKPPISQNDQRNMNRGYPRCRIPARTVSYPKVCRTSRSTSQTMKPALLTYIARDFLLALSVAIVDNTKVMQDHHTLSLTAPLSIVATTARKTLGSPQVRSCIEASSHSAPGFGQRSL